jgi:hypothetical protein
MSQFTLSGRTPPADYLNGLPDYRTGWLEGGGTADEGAHSAPKVNQQKMTASFWPAVHAQSHSITNEHHTSGWPARSHLVPPW